MFGFLPNFAIGLVKAGLALRTGQMRCQSQSLMIKCIRLLLLSQSPATPVLDSIFVQQKTYPPLDQPTTRYHTMTGAPTNTPKARPKCYHQVSAWIRLKRSMARLGLVASP